MSLDTKENREKREAKAEREKPPVPPLNPPFPYRVTPIDLAYFDLLRPPVIDRTAKGE